MESDIADHEILGCSRKDDRDYKIKITELSDFDAYSDIVADYICEVFEEESYSDELKQEALDEFNQGLDDTLENNLAIIVGPYVYTSSNIGAEDEIKDLLDDEGVGYEEYKYPEITCEAKL